MVAVDAEPLLEGEARERQKQHSGTAPGITSIKNDLSVPVPQVQKQVARQFDVSEGYVHAAQKIKDACPQTFEDVKAGVVSIPEAQRRLGIGTGRPGLKVQRAPVRIVAQHCDCYADDHQPHP
jgi:hypothetical protein